VSVKINGMSTDMIFDTGCSTVLISPLEVMQLYKQDLLSDDDILGKTYSMIADGSVTEGVLVNLKSIELTDGKNSVICYDVKAEISNNIGAPVLLGNAVFDRVASYTFDNEAQLIKFKLK
jgi:aspartyl protease family protein